ncbi:Ankyrin repeat protein [Aspergillus fischeri NRRL 181]|uniref:Ankyrin repeat protein n=1 Tax=Neosartorya fischeri (strain ATCC 1020 / DSM 3700 / CBS 544.65 / FGSC A1164 / JCM 1740 / NRRL 181 / WB 181) TaxID=331117 RepID=A1D5N2_NEOFI|nr:Ankyrin repeat protein [Aspergillus fischeri NRRL 181]EAW21026.1 Ankyrin repeat protein [Aspergillus fischeri NRRL 181]KAG2019229.1 hypothetical protein GB937_005142 [Aspergillus fischeri]
MPSSNAHRSLSKWLSDHLHSKEKEAEEVVREMEATEIGTAHRDKDSHHPLVLNPKIEKLTEDDAATDSSNDQAIIKNQVPMSEPSSEQVQVQVSFWDQAAAVLAVENADLYATLVEYKDHSHELRESFAQPEGEEEEEEVKGNGVTKPVRSIADIIAGVAQKQMEDMEHRQWALPAKVKGKETRIRPLLGKILAYASGIKEKADNLIDLDPTGYAKLAWLPFSLVLDLATLDIEQYYAAMDAFSDLSLLVYRYESVDNFYRSQETDTVFEQQLVKLYKMVLECQVALIAHFRRNGLLKFLRAAAVVDDWESTLGDIEEQDKQCQRLLVKYRDKGLVSMQQNAQKLVASVNKKEISRVLKWIGRDPSGQRKLILEDAKLDSDFENAGRWLIDGDLFQKWSSAELRGLQPFWIHAPVIEFLLERAFHKDDEQVAYFYCSKGNAAGSPVAEILRSLVRQLAYSPKDKKLYDEINVLWEARSSPDTDPLTLKECKQILIQLLGRPDSAATLLIDALDECTARVFMSSRDDVDVTRTLITCESVNIEPASVAGDFQVFVKKYVETECQRGHELGEQHNLAIRERLIRSVTDLGQGGFKWAQLQLEYLLDQDPFNPRDLENRISRLESGQGKPVLNDAYDQLYRRKTGEDQGAITHAGRDLQRILHWVLACKIEPKISLVIEALQRDNDPHGHGQGQCAGHVDVAYILRVASNFLVLDDEHILQFAHLSVTEYLQIARAAEYSNIHAHFTISNSCLLYINNCPDSQDIPAPSQYIEDLTFPQYVLKHWCFHCAEIGDEGRKRGELGQRLARLLQVAPVGATFMTFVTKLLAWDPQPDFSNETWMWVSEPPNPFFLACLWGYQEVVDSAIEQDPGIVHLRTRGEFTGLHLAASRCKDRVAERLMRAGADVNATARERYETPLYIAAKANSVRVIELLFQSNDLDVNGDAGGRCPLVEAAFRGSTGAVEALLKHSRIDVNRNIWVTPLGAAVFEEHFDVVALLIKDPRVDVNMDMGFGVVLPHSLIARRNADCVRLLVQIRPDLDINKVDKSFCTAIYSDLVYGNGEFAKIILENRDDVIVNLEDDSSRSSCDDDDYVPYYGSTILHAAVWNNHLEVVKLLLGKFKDSLNPNIQERRGNTALHYAVYMCCIEALEMLLDNSNINLDITNYAGLTALQEAVGLGNLKPTRLLLHHGADKHMAENGSTAEQMARDKGHIEVANLLQGWAG